MGNLGTGTVVGAVLGSLLGLVGLIYLCCFRKHIGAIQTQKLMDATNMIHAQEPIGTVSTGRLPDGTVGLLVSPLPTTLNIPPLIHAPVPISAPEALPGTVPPITSTALTPLLMAPNFDPEEASMYLQPPYNPIGYSPPVSAEFAQPSAPYHPDPYSTNLHQPLGLISHPRPDVVTFIADEVKGDVEPTETKGDDGMEALSPTGSVSIPKIGSPTETVAVFTPRSSSSIPSSSSTFESNALSHSDNCRPNGAPQETIVLIENRNPHEIVSSEAVTPEQSPLSLLAPSPSTTQLSAIEIQGRREYPPMDKSMLPPRPCHSPHEPVLMVVHNPH
ncbi:hypothetical protein BGZ51_000844 [Haplosporangium sp. Z 767]|nr:hypothetical protein BGZ51_000844 [Haplosporangium sp. Z 767]